MEAVWRYLVRVFSHHQIESLVEVILIGLVIWLVFRFLRGTRGETVFDIDKQLVRPRPRGYRCRFRILAQVFRLERVSFLYDNLLFYVFLGALIVFQPELRRALVRLGGSRLFRRLFKAAREVADEICDAVSHMSRARIGALIAIESQAALGGLAESGVRMDADVSSELIRTVFHPGSALHDMGMIIQGDRVTAAGCQFPLTDSDQLDRSLGSRHRAAVGLSEDSNALVIVVSEETGLVSVAYRGQLTRRVAIDSLRAMVGQFLTGQMVLDTAGPEADGHEKTVVTQ